jgi:ketosteroid isomerase-like protein
MSGETTAQDDTGLADRFYGALLGGDIEGCTQLFAADAVVWHNYDLAEQSPADALAQAAAMSSLDARFEVIERVTLPGGWLQQHRFHFSFPDGEAEILAAIHRTHLRDGLIARIDEYMDTGQLGRIVQKAQAMSSPRG